MKRVYVIALCVMALCGCTRLNQRFGLEDDNAVEEFLEDQLESQIKIGVDFTPFSKEPG